jgi:MFS family permease
LESDQAPTRHPSLLADPDLRRYFVARMISSTGVMVAYVVMPVLVYSITDSARWTSFVAIAEGIPYLLIGLFAGALADRADRKRIMVSADVAAGVVLSTIPLAWALDSLTPLHVVIAAFLVQVVFVFFDAANNGALPRLVTRDRLPRANSLVFGGMTVVETAVPGLVGLAFLISSPAPLITVNVITFFASALIIKGLRRPLSGQRLAQQPATRGVITEGLRFIARHRIVRVMTVVGTCQSFAGGAFTALLVVWADRTLGVPDGDWRLGFLFAIWGGGAVLGAWLMPRMFERFGQVRTLLIVVPLSGLGGIATAAAPTWAWAMVAIGTWSIFYMLVASTSVTIRQLVTPEPLMSRVMTVGRMLTFGAGFPTGAFVAGQLATTMSPAHAMLACQATVVLGSVIAWTSRLRRAPRVLEVPDDDTPAPPPAAASTPEPSA